jgi:hypothetical protein
MLKYSPISSDAFFQLTEKIDLRDNSHFGFSGSKFKIAPYVNQTRVF